MVWFLMTTSETTMTHFETAMTHLKQPWPIWNNHNEILWTIVVFPTKTTMEIFKTTIIFFWTTMYFCMNNYSSFLKQGLFFWKTTMLNVLNIYRLALNWLDYFYKISLISIINAHGKLFKHETIIIYFMTPHHIANLIHEQHSQRYGIACFWKS